MNVLAKSLVCLGSTLSTKKRRLSPTTLLLSLSLLPASAQLAHHQSQQSTVQPNYTSSVIVLSPAALTFPVQPVNSSSDASTIFLSDFTTTLLTISSITVTGDFAQTNTCSTNVPGGYGCYIYITFTPTVAGTRAGTLTINESLSDSPRTVALSGTGGPLGSATSTAIASSGSAGAYSLTGTVTGTGSAHVPTGSVSFLDTTNSNVSLGMAALTNTKTTLGLANGYSAATGTHADTIAVADFNNDGKLDAVVASGGYIGMPTTGSPLTILLGKGDNDGGFTAFVGPATPSFPTSVTAGDFNGDGNQDLVVDGGANRSLILLLGQGNGNFTVSTTPITSASSSYATIPTGDLNRDGKLDLVVYGVDATKGPYLQALLGQANGTFLSAVPIYLNALTSYAIGDFNGDGKLDLAVEYASSNSTIPDTVSIYTGNGDGSFNAPSSPISIGILGAGLTSRLLTGDFNGDGKLDLVTEGYLYDPATIFKTLTLSVLLNNGNGAFTAVPTTNTGVDFGQEPGGAAVADFNGDGKTDIAIVSYKNQDILTSNGDGTFTVAVTTDGALTAPDDYWLATGDFNGDGITDTILANSDLDTAAVTITQRTSVSTATLNNIAIPGTGNHNIEASYPGDSNFPGSISGTISLPVSQVVPKLTASSSASSLTFGTQVTLTATLAPYSAEGFKTDGEMITFRNNGSPIGTATLTSGTAVINTTSLPVGTDSIVASYPGDTNFAAATAAAIPVTVNAVQAPSVTPSSTSLSIVAPGGSASTTLQLNGFTGTVNLTCVTNYQGQGTSSDLPTCLFNPAQVAISGGSPGTTTLTVNTSSGSASLSGGQLVNGVSISLAALLFAFILPRGKVRSRLFCSLLACTIVAGVAGCSGGGQSGGTTNSNHGTTTGTYLVSVKATSGTTSVSTSVTVNLQ